MGFREVTMVEVKEVLRLWLAGEKKKRIAARLGMDPKTVRRYIETAERCGVSAGHDEATLTDAKFTEILVALQPAIERAHGDGWQRCVDERAEIAALLARRVRLSKVRRLLLRRGVDIPYSTLHRFAVSELGFGRASPTVRVDDGKPGEEIQLDTGWMTLLEPDEDGRRRRFRAWIFTPSVSRYRFVYPCFAETTATAIEACEAAWAFYGGMFSVIVPDNTKAIVHTADPLTPRLVHAFLEYVQARGLHVDPTRTRSPRDKARVERSVRDVRDDCFAGETLHTLDDARERARVWSADEYGMRRHTTTQRLPREHFDTVEKPALKLAPTDSYDVPIWAEPKVARDQHAQVARALYSLPRRFVGKTLRARADRNTVRFYEGALLVKTHLRMPPGKRATDPADFPPEKTVYAMRDIAFLERQAAEHGDAVGRYARLLLDAPLPWTRMRRVYALLGLVKRYGAFRVDDACARALDADMVDVHRLERMLKLAAPPPSAPTEPARVIPIGRYLRPASDYALPCVREGLNEGDPE
jgi:transposase